jgi:hypothetical protein
MEEGDLLLMILALWFLGTINSTVSPSINSCGAPRILGTMRVALFRAGKITALANVNIWKSTGIALSCSVNSSRGDRHGPLPAAMGSLGQRTCWAAG